MNIELTELSDIIMRSYLRGYEDGKQAKKDIGMGDIIISAGNGMDAQGIAAAVKTQIANMNSHMSAEYTETR